MTRPRIRPGTPRELGIINTLITRALGLAAGTAPPNLFTTLGRHRKLFRRWLAFAGGLMPGGRLPRRDTRDDSAHPRRGTRRMEILNEEPAEEQPSS